MREPLLKVFFKKYEYMIKEKYGYGTIMGYMRTKK